MNPVKTNEIWSGRGDLNARPSAPKTVFGSICKRHIFNAFSFKQLRRSSCTELTFVEALGGSCYKIIYIA